MATADQIEEVRTNTAQPTAAVWSDSEIGVLVDAGTVNTASARIWRALAATYVTATDRSEAGASIKLDPLYAKAISQAEYYEGLDLIGTDAGKLPAKVHQIVRQT